MSWNDETVVHVRLPFCWLRLFMVRMLEVWCPTSPPTLPEPPANLLEPTHHVRSPSPHLDATLARPAPTSAILDQTCPNVGHRAKNLWINIATNTPSMTMPTTDSTAATHDCRLSRPKRSEKTRPWIAVRLTNKD
jgi:hypothetical protein